MKIRIKWGNVIFTLVVLILMIVGLINPVRLSAIKNIEKLNYSETTAKKIVKNGLKDLTMKYDYSSFVDRESTPKYYFTDNGILNLFLIDKRGSLIPVEIDLRVLPTINILYGVAINFEYKQNRK